ncbi:MAG: helicase, partial [Lachnospiraceae bacterium]
METERTGEDAGRGSSPSADRNEISLGADEELNRELNEINSFGNSKEANYHQASFFDGDFGLNTSGLMHVQTTKISAAGQKYTYIQPKKELVVPHEFVRQTLLRGTGFVNGMSRVCKIYQNEIDAGTRARRIKKEYGQGGAGWPIEGYGLHGYDSFHAQGLRFQWRDEEGEKEGYISWGTVEKEIGVLIMTGEYQPERQSLDEISMDADREDYVDIVHRVIDATDEQEVVEVVDAFAIPDEPESYESHRKITEQKAETETYEMTPEELAEEDRMVTMAEYGAEIEAENREYEKQYEESHSDERLEVIPTDYANIIADMDEDMREAMEILVTECSCYMPFKPFLQDIVNSEYLLIPNKLELLSDM